MQVLIFHHILSFFWSVGFTFVHILFEPHLLREAHVKLGVCMNDTTPFFCPNCM